MQSTVKKNKDIISAEDPLKGFGSYKVHKLQQIKLQTIFIKELWEIQHKWIGPCRKAGGTFPHHKKKPSSARASQGGQDSK